MSSQERTEKASGGADEPTVARPWLGVKGVPVIQHAMIDIRKVDDLAEMIIQEEPKLTLQRRK